MEKISSFSFVLIGVQLVLSDVLVYDKAHRQIDVEFRDLQANFGGEIPTMGIRAYVVYAAPENGCSELKPPPPVELNFTEHWAVLIRRYNCSFEMKVRNAQKAGYDIAIVHNVDSSELEKMTAEDSKGILIPSIFVGSNTGQAIKERFLYNSGYYLIIDDDDSPFDIGAHLLIPFAVVVAVCFLTMVGFMVVKCVKDHRRARRHRLPSSSLNKIPTIKHRKNFPFETCAICLDDFVEGEKLRVLPCSHAYHCKCIDPWLTHNKRVCPMCKRRVFTDDVLSDSESGSDDDNTPLLRQATTTTRGGTFDRGGSPPNFLLEFYLRFVSQHLQEGSESSASTGSGEAHSQDQHTASVESTSSSSHYEPIYNVDNTVVQPGGESSVQAHESNDDSSVNNHVMFA